MLNELKENRIYCAISVKIFFLLGNIKARKVFFKTNFYPTKPHNVCSYAFKIKVCSLFQAWMTTCFVYKVKQEACANSKQPSISVNHWRKVWKPCWTWAQKRFIQTATEWHWITWCFIDKKPIQNFEFIHFFPSNLNECSMKNFNSE